MSPMCKQHLSAASRSAYGPEQEAADLPAQKPGVTTSAGPQVDASFHLSMCTHEAFQPLSMLFQSFSSKCVACTCLRCVSIQYTQQTKIYCFMLVRLAKIITHLGTHISPPTLQLSLTMNVYGELLTVASDSPGAQSTAADGICMQTFPLAALKSTCRNRWLNQCVCTTGIQHRRYSWAAPEPAGQGARSSRGRHPAVQPFLQDTPACLRLPLLCS